MSEEEKKTAPRPRKLPRKITPRYLENAALHYLKRYASSVANLRRVLMRKVDRSIKVHGGDRAQFEAMVDELLGRLERASLLNDEAYARGKVASLRRRGTSARAIAFKLKQKGLDEKLVTQQLEAWEEASPDAELQAAEALARRRKLGPYGKPELRRERRQKDLAALVRAGFAYPVAKKIVDMELDP